MSSSLDHGMNSGFIVPNSDRLPESGMYDTTLPSILSLALHYPSDMPAIRTPTKKSQSTSAAPLPSTPTATTLTPRIGGSPVGGHLCRQDSELNELRNIKKAQAIVNERIRQFLLNSDAVPSYPIDQKPCPKGHPVGAPSLCIVTNNYRDTGRWYQLVRIIATSSFMSTDSSTSDLWSSVIQPAAATGLGGSPVRSPKNSL